MENDTRESRIQAAKKRKFAKSIAIWGISAVVLAGLIWLMVRTNKPASGIHSTLSKTINDQDWSRGNTQAKVTVLEYGDFQCPACGVYYPLLKQLESQFDDRVRFVFRHFPLSQIHAHALLAATAAEAAGKQGKFWEMHDLLYENQTTWSTSSDTKNLFRGYAEKIGLNIDSFMTDLEASDTRAEVDKDFADGRNSGVQGTPTFFVNGAQIENPGSVSAFESILNDALKSNP